MNNYNYMNYNWYRDMDRKNTDYNNQKLFNPKEGFIKGNMLDLLFQDALLHLLSFLFQFFGLQVIPNQMHKI